MSIIVVSPEEYSRTFIIFEFEYFEIIDFLIDYLLLITKYLIILTKLKRFYNLGL